MRGGGGFIGYLLVIVFEPPFPPPPPLNHILSMDPSLGGKFAVLRVIIVTGHGERGIKTTLCLHSDRAT